MGCVVDDRIAGKVFKKKFLSDFSRRGELVGFGFEGFGGEFIREVEFVLFLFSSEFIFVERRVELEEFSFVRGRV